MSILVVHVTGKPAPSLGFDDALREFQMQYIGRTLRRLTCLPLLAASAVAGVGCESAAELRSRGIDAMKMGHVPEADRSLTRSEQLDPSSWRTQYWLGKVRLAQERWADAQRYLEQAYVLRNSHDETPDIVDGIAEAMYQQRLDMNLRGLLARATQRYGTSYDFVRQGRYLVRIDDPDNAKIALRKAARIADEDDPTPYLAMAEMYELIGNRKAAIKALRQAHGIAPDDSNIRKRLRSYGIVPGPTAALPPDRDDQ